MHINTTQHENQINSDIWQYLLLDCKIMKNILTH